MDHDECDDFEPDSGVWSALIVFAVIMVIVFGCWFVDQMVLSL